MIHERLAPGKEDGNQAHLRSQMLGIFRQLLDGLRCGLEKHGVDQPTLFIQTPADGAMAVPAGVAGYPQLATMVALIHMTTQGCCAADLDGPHDRG